MFGAQVLTDLKNVNTHVFNRLSIKIGTAVFIVVICIVIGFEATYLENFHLLNYREVPENSVTKINDKQTNKKVTV